MMSRLDQMDFHLNSLSTTLFIQRFQEPMKNSTSNEKLDWWAMIGGLFLSDV